MNKWTATAIAASLAATLFVWLLFSGPTRIPVLLELRRQPSPTLSLVFLKDNNMLVSGASYRNGNAPKEATYRNGGAITKWDLRSSTAERTVYCPIPTALTVSPNGEVLAVGSALWDIGEADAIEGPPKYRPHGQIALYDADTLDERKKGIVLDQGIIGLSFVEGHDILAALSTSSRIEGRLRISLWDAANGTEVKSLEIAGLAPTFEQRGPIRLLDCTFDGAFLIVATGGTVGLENGSEGAVVLRGGKPIGGHSTKPKGKITIIDVKKFEVVGEVELATAPVTFIDASENGRLLTFVSGENCYIADAECSTAKVTNVRWFMGTGGGAFVRNNNEEVIGIYNRSKEDGEISIAGGIFPAEPESGRGQVARNRSLLAATRTNRIAFATAITNDLSKLAIGGNDGIIQVWDLPNTQAK